MIDVTMLTREHVDISLLEYYLLNSERNAAGEALNKPFKAKRSKKTQEYTGNQAFLYGFFDEKLGIEDASKEQIALYVYGKAIRTALLQTAEHEFKQIIIEAADLPEKILGYVKGPGFQETNRIYDFGLLKIGVELFNALKEEKISIYKKT